MVKTKIVIGVALVVLGTLILFFGRTAAQAPTVQAQVAQPIRYAPTHRQEVWRNVLEWCESRGNVEAVNPNDRDHTPSYYSFQWKPDTFKGYGEKYGILKKGLSRETIMEKMKDYNTQVLILNEMIGDQVHIPWSNEFPDCVRKYGPPPSK